MGATEQEGGACEVLPLRKGGDGKSFSHAVGGEGGRRKKFPLFKRGALKVLPCLERAGGGGGGLAPTVLDLRFSYFVVPPLSN